MKKTLAIVLAVMMLVAVFVVPTSAMYEHEGSVPMLPLDAYSMLLGTEAGYARFAEWYDWTDTWQTTDIGAATGTHLQNLGSSAAIPTFAINTYYFPEENVYEAGMKLGVNWTVTKTLGYFICQNLELATGLITLADESYLVSVNVQEPVAVSGIVQFITTMATNTEGNWVMQTYANGDLVFEAILNSSLPTTAYSYADQNTDGTAFNALCPAVETQGVRCINRLDWYKKPTSLLVTGAYNAFALYYGRNVKLYPQDVTKTGIIIGANGIRNFKSGVARTGFVSGRYYMKETTYLCMEDKVIGGVYYTYNKANGKMVAYNGLHDGYYYVDGVKYGGWVDADGDGINDTYYYLESKEKCTTSRWIGGVYYEYDALSDKLTACNGFLDDEGEVYYLIDGVKATGWQEIDGDWYYFYKESGKMVYDITRTIGGVMHTFDADGICTTK